MYLLTHLKDVSHILLFAFKSKLQLESLAFALFSSPLLIQSRRVSGAQPGSSQPASVSQVRVTVSDCQTAQVQMNV